MASQMNVLLNCIQVGINTGARHQMRVSPVKGQNVWGERPSGSIAYTRTSLAGELCTVEPTACLPG